MPTAADHVFGHGHRIHPVTKRPLESGIGALSDAQQAALHLIAIEREEGAAAADKMRKKLGIPTQADRDAAAKAQAAEDERTKARTAKALALLEEHEKAEAAKTKDSTNG